jgi:membrane-bound lytic murein transglycosylase A
MDGAAPFPHNASGIDPVLYPISFSGIDGWRDDDHIAALAAFRIGAAAIAAAPPKTRALGVDGRGLPGIAQAALQISATDRHAARLFFERRFVPHRVRAAGFVTGYYEPEVEAGRARTDRFTFPLYRRPPDLVDVSAVDPPPGWDPGIRFARATASGLRPYYDRSAIEGGALAGRGLELAWLADAVDAFFIHVQGSARLKFAVGETMRIAFDGKSGHPYTSIGRLAVERGLLSLEEAHKDGLEAWLKSRPAEGRALMRENRSFIFFREADLKDDDGPLGAAGVPLSAGRSLAVDRALHTFHIPVWVDARGLADPARPAESFRRLMIAQDTGSAIVGPARGDIFFGSGKAAGSAAGRVRHDASLIVLVPAKTADAA